MGAIGDAIGGITNAVGDIAGAFGGMAGQVAGSMFGGPLGGMLGGVLGDALGGITQNVLGDFSKIADSIMPDFLKGGIGDIVKNLFGGGTEAPQIDEFPPMTERPTLPAKGEKGDIDALMSALAQKTDKMYESLEKAVGNLSDKPSQKEMQEIQMAMGKYNQMTQMLSTLQKDLDDMNMSIVRNMKN